MKRLAFSLVVLASLGSAACGAKQPLPPVEPPVAEVVSDAGAGDVDAAPAAQTLYDRLGGKDGVEAVVDSFTKNLLADPRVNKAFKKSKDGLAQFKQHLAEQICQLAAGPCQYSGKSMVDAHKGMGVTDAQFDAVVEDLKLALDEKGASEQDKSELFGALAPTKGEIVESKKGGKKK
jgi:hemoglobin